MLLEVRFPPEGAGLREHIAENFRMSESRFRCWKNATPYDESGYLMALQEKGSTLLKTIAKTENALAVHLRAYVRRHSSPFLAYSSIIQCITEIG